MHEIIIVSFQLTGNRELFHFDVELRRGIRRLHRFALPCNWVLPRQQTGGHGTAALLTASLCAFLLLTVSWRDLSNLSSFFRFLLNLW